MINPVKFIWNTGKKIGPKRVIKAGLAVAGIASGTWGLYDAVKGEDVEIVGIENSEMNTESAVDAKVETEEDDNVEVEVETDNE